MDTQTTLDLIDTDTEPAAAPESTEPTEVSVARDLMFATLDAAKKAHPKYRFKDVTTTVIGIDPGYAKEWRLIAGTLAAVEHVFAVGMPRGVGGKYKAGYDVELYGFKADLARVVERFEQVRVEATAGMTAATPRQGEDTGTFRSSWLLGYRLGLTPVEMDRELVEKTVIGPLPRDGRVSMRSTGSGAWAGFCAARGIEQQHDEQEVVAA